MTTSDNDTPFRRCSKCGEEKPETYEYFPWDKKRDRPHGRCCRLCGVLKNKRWRDANLERSKAYVLQWARDNRDRVNESNRRYRDAHRERVRKASQTFRENHPERVRADRQQYHAKYPEKSRAKTRRYRTRKVQLICNFTPLDEQLALEYFNGCCATCGRQLKDLLGTHTVHFDHWIPLAKGGHTTPDNMLPLCGGKGGCNNSKSDKDPDKWLVERFGKRKTEIVLKRIRSYFEYIKGIAGGYEIP